MPNDTCDNMLAEHNLLRLNLLSIMYILDCNHGHVATKYTIEQYTEENINIYQLSNFNIDEKTTRITLTGELVKFICS